MEKLVITGKTKAKQSRGFEDKNGPVTHDPETGAIGLNSTRFRRQFFVPMHDDF